VSRAERRGRPHVLGASSTKGTPAVPFEEEGEHPRRARVDRGHGPSWGPERHDADIRLDRVSGARLWVSPAAALRGAPLELGGRRRGALGEPGRRVKAGGATVAARRSNPVDKAIRTRGARAADGGASLLRGVQWAHVWGGGICTGANARPPPPGRCRTCPRCWRAPRGRSSSHALRRAQTSEELGGRRARVIWYLSRKLSLPWPR
jgi:hypothetical protein